MSRPARKKNTPKAGDDSHAKVKSSVIYDADVYRYLQLASIDTGFDMSKIINDLVRREYGGWHIRKSRAAVGGVEAQNNPTPPDPDASDVRVSPGQTPTVRIAGVTNRIGEIARRSALPVDDAIDSMTGDHGRPE